MKKKGPRHIPDFSAKRAPTPGLQQPPKGGAARAASHPQAVNVKPQATSAKSGRRGQ
jgi:hypothetical protein